MKLLLTILFATISILGIAQNVTTDTSVTCVAYWKKGEQKKFLIAHSKENLDSGKLKSDGVFAYQAEVLIKDFSDKGYVIQWIFRLPEALKKQIPQLSDNIPVFDGMKMLFTTSIDGAFLELINWEEVRNSYINLFELSLPQKMDSATKAAIDQTKGLFNTREMVESAFIKEIQLFHVPFGHIFTTTLTKTATELTNPFGGEPIPAAQTVQVTELNIEKDQFKLSLSDNIDKEKVQQYLKRLLDKLNINKDTSAAEIEKNLSSLVIADEKEYDILISTGWPKKIKYKRTGKADAITKTEYFIIEMID